MGPQGPAGQGQLPRTTFGFGFGSFGNTMALVAHKDMPEGSWAVVATVQIDEPDHIGSDWNRTAACQLRANGGVIGGAHSRAFSPDDASVNETLTMNGGAAMGSGGGNVEVWCSWQGDPFTSFGNAQMMFTETTFF